MSMTAVVWLNATIYSYLGMMMRPVPPTSLEYVPHTPSPQTASWSRFDSSPSWRLLTDLALVLAPFDAGSGLAN